MVTVADLKRLVEVNLNERAFLSLYLAGPSGLESVRSQLRRDWSVLAGDAEEAAYLSENRGLAEEILSQRPPSGPTALFVSAPLHFVERFDLKAPVKNLAWVGRGPYLRPLARLLDEFETYAVVIADNRRAVVHLVEAGAKQEIRSIRGDIKNRVKKGGWSQQRYERRRDKQLLRYGREVATDLEQLDREESFGRLILVGSSEAVRTIEGELSPSLASRLVGKRSLDLGKGDGYVESEIQEIFVAAERAEEADRWRRIQTAQLQGGQAAFGVEEVWPMAEQGRVAEALITQDVRLPGRRCPACEHLSFGEPESCTSCGTVGLLPVDALNEIAERLVATSAEVDFALGLEPLADVGHVAARLRW